MKIARVSSEKARKQACVRACPPASDMGANLCNARGVIHAMPATQAAKGKSLLNALCVRKNENEKPRISWHANHRLWLRVIEIFLIL